VDNQNKVVFNGSDLGKDYSAAALQSRLGSGEKDVSATHELKSGDTSNSNWDKIQHKQFDKSNDLPVKNESLLETLMSAKEQFENVPNSLLQKKRKKKRKNQNL
jgi:hypothetical protein